MNLNSLDQQTQAIYNRNAEAFDRQRAKKLHEKKWLDRFTAYLPSGSHILDLGCGAGDPIASYFIDQGYRVTGVDFAEAMLSLARERFPDSTWMYADMRVLSLDEAFDGIIGWNSFFHLNQQDQRSTLPLLIDHLRPGGILMLTVGHEAGEVTGHVNGEKVYHASLSPAEYEEILGDLEATLLEFVPEDEECDFQTVLLAQKIATM